MLKTKITFAILGAAITAAAQTNSNPLPTVPSGVVPANCYAFKINKQYKPLLDCYLTHADNYLVRNFIDTNVSGPQGTSTKWTSWPAAYKEQLAYQFGAMQTWYEGGMNVFSGYPTPEEPPNLMAGFWYTKPTTVLDQYVLWCIYRDRIAMLLAAEIFSWVPWSVKSYLEPTTSASFYPLFGDRMTGKGYYDANGSWVLVGRGPMYDATPGSPLPVFKFLKTNNLIGPTRQETINRILNWSRWNMAHMFGGYTAANYEAYWQYRGETPVIKILRGTVTTSPDAPEQYRSEPYHWTQGCYGTTSFLIEVFQVVNIPVVLVNVGYHAAPYFPAERKYLTHGDDPYTSLSKSSRPVSAFMIDAQKFQAWFPADDMAAGDVNVGRGPYEDNINHPSQYLVDLHKQDMQEGRTRAESRVYQGYKRWYTVEALEQTGLWNRLNQLAGY